MSFLRRQVITAALTANAIRPLPGFRTGIPAFFAGWLTGELAPHVLAVTTADALAHATGSRRDARGLALAGASVLGLGYLIAQSRQVATRAEEALVDGLGADYVEQLDTAPTPAELAVPWRKLVYPFRMREPRVTVHKNIAYDDETGRRGLLDVYVPAETPPQGAPVLLQVHGGGWTIGNKDQQGIPLMQHLAAKGWVCVAINY
ncbi:MAG: alpha/beta hydrolase, partial [Actinomycetota bacterium]|nr:alpha/beta hydrolase [Actinomycetota bacterium]